MSKAESPRVTSENLGTSKKREKFIMTPEATWDQVMEVLRVADSSTPAALEEAWNVHGRNTLDRARGVFFESLVGILKVKHKQDRAESKEAKLKLQEEKRTLIPKYGKSIKEIVEASSIIAMWKRTEGKKRTDPEVERKVYEKWTEKMIEYGKMIGYEVTAEEADFWVSRSIATTKEVQGRKGVTEDPPSGGLRVVYEIIKNVIEEQEAASFPK